MMKTGFLPWISKPVTLAFSWY